MKKAFVMWALFGLCGRFAFAQSVSQTPSTPVSGLDTVTAIRDNPGLYSIVLSRDNHIVYEKYFNGAGKDDLRNDQSLTKDICSLLIGIAIDKGYIHSVDEKISRWFPELNKDTDARKRTITIRELMNQASGLNHEQLGTMTGIGDFLALPDPSGYTLQAPMVGDPGREWHYNNAATHLLSLIITRSTGMNTLSFAEKYLFHPLGIQEVSWMKMKDGYYDGSGLLSIRLRTCDLIKIGYLLLQEGQYAGRVIVSRKWIDSILRPMAPYNADWGFQSSTYALCWYHARAYGVEITYGMGWGGQFLVVIPSLRAVMAVNESVSDFHAIAQSTLFITKIFPALLKAISF
jgi:CubicO group peptidase (beta-lactamase class C family)